MRSPNGASVRAPRSHIATTIRAAWGALRAFGAGSLAVLILVVSGACSPAFEPIAQSDTVSLSISGVALAPGQSRDVGVTVKRRESEVHLRVAGLPPGVEGTFQPGILKAGETRSILTLAAATNAPLGATTLTITAAVPGAPMSSTSLPSASLSVRICPASAIPTHCPPFETGGARSISGVVLERSAGFTGVLAGIHIWAWVQTPLFGYSRGRVESGANGGYRIGDLPDSRVLLQAWSSEYDQPCGVLVELDGASAIAHIELSRVGSPMDISAPTHPALVGEVFEIGSGGRRPIAAARVFFETAMDLVAATATTDELGRYTLCRLPALEAVQTLTVLKPGYQPAVISVTVSGLQYRDIELKRQ